MWERILVLLLSRERWDCGDGAPGRPERTSPIVLASHDISSIDLTDSLPAMSTAEATAARDDHFRNIV